MPTTSASTRQDRSAGLDDAAKGRILIVDDVDDNREILAVRLRHLGFETLEAADGQQALALVETERLDLVLLDVMMPGMSGTDVLQRIRADHSATLLPVIMVTARGLSENVVDAIGLGANDYVTKPIDMPVAVARITSHIERRRAAMSVEDALVAQTARLAEADRKSAYLADHDALTGLLNRSACDRRLPDLLAAARAAGEGLAVLAVGLDGVTKLNDALGHAVGDALIRDVAEALRRTGRSRDLVARLGGDEFCVLHLAADVAESASCLAQDLIAAVAGPCAVAGHQLFASITVGVGVADETLVEAGELLQRADIALHHAKRERRGGWIAFAAGMDAAARDRLALETDLRDALAKGELELHYQPIVDVQQHRVVGFEALLRWDRGASGFVPPDRFIPIAEETGLIVPIGDWVLRRACEEAARWPEDVRVAVNVSPAQLRGRHLLETVVGALAASRLAPNRLELELTESALLSDGADTLAIMRDLRGLGIRLSMDDFGTGYSSLGYFRSFPFDKVKIDRSFVSDTTKEREGRAIVRAVVGLGEAFGMATLAEGVETQAQLEYLRQEGCREVQGYLLGKPEPAGAVDELIARFNGPR